jgi:hypothetical protein
MTAEEVLARAREAALRSVWLWTEPVRQRRYRRWLVGPVTWEVVSNAERRGGNVVVVLDDATGTVQRKAFLPR